MKIFLHPRRPFTVAASLLAATTLLAGCGPEEDQLNSALSSSDYRTTQVAPHIRTGSGSGLYFISNLPAGDRRHSQQRRPAQPDRHRSNRQPQLGPAAVN